MNLNRLNTLASLLLLTACTPPSDAESIDGCRTLHAQGAQPHAWALVCGSSGTDRVDALEVTPSGDVLVALSVESFEGPAPILEFDDSTYEHAGSTDPILLRVDADGSLLWSRAFPTEGYAEFGTVSACGDGFVVFGSAEPGALDLGDGPIEHEDFMARFDGAGSLLWSRSFPVAESGWVRAADLACDAAGSVIIAGDCRDGVDFGAGMQDASVADSFLAKYDGDGALLFGRTLSTDKDRTGDLDTYAAGVAIGPNDSIYLALQHGADVDFGDRVIEADPTNESTLLVRLSESGDVEWSASVGGNGPVLPRSLEVDDEGRAVVAGIFLNEVELGGQTLRNVFPEQEQDPDLVGTNYDVFVAAFDRDGRYAWGHADGTMRDDGIGVTRFGGDEALTLRTSDDRLQLVSFSGSGTYTVVDVDVSGQAFESAYAAGDDAVVISRRVASDASWPPATRHTPSGDDLGDALVVYFEL